MTKRKAKRRASLGVALIARDAADTIGQCLDSFRPYCEQIVVGVDELTKDKTAAVAKRHGADIVVPIQVSDWHECPQHGRVLVQHFANAREQSFSHLDKSLDFLMWIDADDILEGAERLPQICDELMAGDAVGAWAPYHYGNVQGRVSTLFSRERILRTDVGWKWRYRVHEVVEAVGPQRNGWHIREDIKFIHQDHERSESAPVRNLRCLEIDYEENPNDARTLFYLGNQYFAMQRNEEAAFWYQQLLENQDRNPYQRWQSAIYLSMALQRIGNLDGGEQAALQAISIMPQHAEPYYQLAVIARFKGDAERCLYWTNEARTNKTKPPFFVFTNPLDDQFNHRVVISDALAMLGRVPEARVELEHAAAVLPEEGVVEGIARYRHLENCGAVAQAYTTLASALPDEAKISLWEALAFPPDVRQFGRARDVVMPAYLRQRPNTQPRIVFWCGRSFEEWAPPSLNTTGIGGSETAVIEIGRRFASAGWRVDVYNGAGRYEGEYDWAGYWEPERFDGTPSDVLVSWRQPNFATEAPFKASLLWCHDLNYGPQPSHVLPGLWGKVLGVSQWHADYLSRQYGIETDFVPNGINLDRFTLGQRRVPMQVVYASSPDRGLSRLLSLWPEVLKAEPGATLKIAYGWDNFDKMLQQRPEMGQWKDAILGQIERTPNVEWIGRQPQDKLAELWCKSYAWAYPSDFLEVSCITAMEAMAGGAVPVVSSAGALPETVGHAGVIVTGNPLSRAWESFYTQCLIAVLREANLRQPLKMAGPERAKELTWDQAFAKWLWVIDGLLGDRSPEDATSHNREAVLV